MGLVSLRAEVVGQLFHHRIVKFGITDASDANDTRRNRSGTIMLPIKAVVTGASACVLE